MSRDELFLQAQADLARIEDQNRLLLTILSAVDALAKSAYNPPTMFGMMGVYRCEQIARLVEMAYEKYPELRVTEDAP